MYENCKTSNLNHRLGLTVAILPPHASDLKLSFKCCFSYAAPNSAKVQYLRTVQALNIFIIC